LLYKVHSVPPVVLRQFALSCILDEVKSTNDIEGVHSTRKEIKEILDGVSSSSRFSSIVNKYYNILNNEKIDFSTNDDIRKFYDIFAHEEVAAEHQENRLDGKLFRKNSVDIMSSNDKTIHRGIFPEEKILTSMEEALSILNSDEIPLLVRVSIFHYLFGYIHPFYDGNGRTDRFITSYFLAQHFHYIVALRLSVLIKRNRKQYYKLFSDMDSEINRGDLTPFVYGFMSIISDTFQDIIDILERKRTQLKKYEEKLNQMNFKDTLMQNIYYILLQSALFYGQGISIKELQDITHKARGTVQRRLDSIPKNYLVIRKNRTLYYKLNMIIFKEQSQ